MKTYEERYCDGVQNMTWLQWVVALSILLALTTSMVTGALFFILSCLILDAIMKR